MKAIFPVNIFNGGYIEVDYDLTDEEYELLMSYKQKYDDLEDDSEEFEDAEELSELYEKIQESAFDEMANSLFDNPDLVPEELEDGFDFEEAREYITDNFDITIGYPEDLGTNDSDTSEKSAAQELVKEWTCTYSATFGAGDSSDDVEIDIPCTEEEYEILKMYYYVALGEDEDGNEIEDDPRFEDWDGDPEDDSNLEEFIARAKEIIEVQAREDIEEYLPEEDFDSIDININYIDPNISI